MEKIILSFLIITGFYCWGKKYVFVDDSPKTWAEAKDYCQEKYVNILALDNKKVEGVFKKSGSNKGWIGIYWEKSMNKWKWWGAGDVNYSSSTLDVVLNYVNIDKNVYWTNYGWRWQNGESSMCFYCLNMLVVQEQKTWEDALEHCRKNDSDLISLLSWAENYLAMKEIEPLTFDESVWIGMRYLGDSWMWVNGDPLEYTAWLSEEDQDYQCPRLSRCGALTKEGKWENRDCEEKLSFICA